MLRDFARNWLPLLFNAFIAADKQDRTSLGNAIAAYASIADPASLPHFFREVIKKLLKVCEAAICQVTLHSNMQCMLPVSAATSKQVQSKT